MPEPPKKAGFWHKLFGASKNETPVASTPSEPAVTPLPATTEPVVHSAAKPIYSEPAPVTFSRYNYISPAKPAAGDRRAASGAFTKARVLEQDEQWTEALRWYQSAAELDPSWFEAQYNTGVFAHKLRNYPLALPSYENALAIQPDAADARYNFALALKAAGHAPDAADELKKNARGESRRSAGAPGAGQSLRAIAARQCAGADALSESAGTGTGQRPG